MAVQWTLGTRLNVKMILLKPTVFLKRDTRDFDLVPTYWKQNKDPGFVKDTMKRKKEE